MHIRMNVIFCLISVYFLLLFFFELQVLFVIVLRKSSSVSEVAHERSTIMTVLLL